MKRNVICIFFLILVFNSIFSESVKNKVLTQNLRENNISQREKKLYKNIPESEQDFFYFNYFSKDFHNGETFYVPADELFVYSCKTISDVNRLIKVDYNNSNSYYDSNFSNFKVWRWYVDSYDIESTKATRIDKYILESYLENRDYNYILISTSDGVGIWYKIYSFINNDVIMVTDFILVKSEKDILNFLKEENLYKE